MKKRIYLFLATIGVATLLLSGCVSQKKYNLLANKYDDALNRFTELNKSCELQGKNLTLELDRKYTLISKYLLDLATKDSLLNAEKRLTVSLAKELNFMRESNNSLLGRLTDMAVINKAGADNIKQSLMAINEQNNYIRDLTKTIQSKDSLNLALVMNLKRSLADINDEDVQVEIKKGVVYISLSDKMLYRSGSADINPKALDVLGKIAKVLNDHEDLDILVEGHTDNVPIATTLYADNWDLSVKRATSVVRVLQWRYNIDPERMTAGGRSEYLAKADNSTTQGRQINRRTEIILLPKLDQFFKLLEPNMGETVAR